MVDFLGLGQLGHQNQRQKYSGIQAHHSLSTGDLCNRTVSGILSVRSNEVNYAAREVILLKLRTLKESTGGEKQYTAECEKLSHVG